jgi:hypothetical protein
MTDEEFLLDDDRPRYFVRTYRTEDERTLVWVPDLDITLEGDWRWVDDAEAAAVGAIAAKLQVPATSFAVDVDCPIDMDPEISPEFKADLERRAAEHDACVHDWRQVFEQEAADDPLIKTLTARGNKASLCTKCGSLEFGTK